MAKFTGGYSINYFFNKLIPGGATIVLESILKQGSEFKLVYWLKLLALRSLVTNLAFGFITEHWESPVSVYPASELLDILTAFIIEVWYFPLCLFLAKW